MTIKTTFIPASRDTESRFIGKDKVCDTVDGAELAQQIENTCNALVESGYAISQIIPIASGGHNYKNGVGYGYGYGYTSGVIVIAQKI